MNSKLNILVTSTAAAVLSLLIAIGNAYAKEPSHIINPRAPDKPGTVTGKGLTSGARGYAVTIQDPDGIQYYSVYEVGSNKSLLKPEINQGNCAKQKILKFNSADTGAIRVQYVDCSARKNGFIVKNFTSEADRPGEPSTWINIGANGQILPTLDFADMNTDGIIDVVVLDGDTGRISVYIGNGDGSLQEPTLGGNRIVLLPGRQFPDILE